MNGWLVEALHRIDVILGLLVLGIINGRVLMWARRQWTEDKRRQERLEAVTRTLEGDQP